MQFFATRKQLHLQTACMYNIKTDLRQRGMKMYTYFASLLSYSSNQKLHFMAHKAFITCKM